MTQAPIVKHFTEKTITNPRYLWPIYVDLLCSTGYYIRAVQFYNLSVLWLIAHESAYTPSQFSVFARFVY